MPFAHRQRSRLNDFVFSASFLVNNQLRMSCFAPEKNLKKYVEDFSDAFLFWLSVFEFGDAWIERLRLPLAS